MNTSTGHNIARNTTWLTAAYIIQKIFAFFYFTLIARFIGAEDIGIYTFAISLTTVFSIFIDLGLSSVLIREVAKYKEKANLYLNNIITAKIILAVLSYVAVFIIINLLNKSAITREMVYLAGLVMILDSFTLIFFAVFRAFQNLKYEAISIGINQIVILIIGLGGILLHSPLIILVMALFAGSLFNFIYAWIMLKSKLNFKFQIVFNKEVLKTLFILAAPFALAGIFVRVYSYIDQILLSILIGDKTVGWYSVPFKITYAFQFIPAAFAAAIYPAMSHFYLNDRTKLTNIFEKSMYLLIISSVPAAVGIACLADKIILSLYTAEFTPSILALQIFIFAVIPMFLNYPVGSILNSCDKQAKNTINMGATMILNILLNLLLIPRYQHIGAAIAALTSLTTLFFLNLLWVPKIMPDYNYKFLLLKASQTIIATIIMLGVILILKPYLNFIILVILGAGVYVAIMYLIKGFTKDDLNYIYQAVFKKSKPIDTEQIAN